jgi:hypothetical protein
MRRERHCAVERVDYGADRAIDYTRSYSVMRDVNKVTIFAALNTDADFVVAVS